jgi:NAD(P)-dependent dehydrogenase (short-subunit alcohol dehydrogenase family)
MATSGSDDPNSSLAARSIRAVTGQSPPIDLRQSYDASWVRGKTILITGGASGFGKGFCEVWAGNGAHIMMGDIDVARGKALIQELRRSTGSEHHHFFECDITNWQQQVDMFHQAIKLSPTGGLDAVVANAGISDPMNPPFFAPRGLDADTPPPPNIKSLQVNLIGLTYTTHLALFYLPRNPGSSKADYSAAPGPERRDRHLLLLGSIASLGAIPGQPLYGVAKHGVLGLFRSLRTTASSTGGVRINMLCPYFISTPILTVGARFLLAGGAFGQPEDVVEAGTRLMADTRIVGRALIVGPKVKVNKEDEWEVVPYTDKNGVVQSCWEAYADDADTVEAFSVRFVGLLNAVERARGWTGWVKDMGFAGVYAVRSALGYR